MTKTINKPTEKIIKPAFLTLILALSASYTSAQNLVGGINAANSMLRTYIDPITDVVYAVCVVMFIAGAGHVAIKLNQGERNVTKEISLWIGGIVFLLVSIAAAKSAMGV